MNIFQAVALGIIQGLTEFLPISSSGHLVLAQKFLKINESAIVFDVALHFATLLAIVVFFFKDILALRFKELIVLAVGTLPAVLVGLFFKPQVESLFAYPLLVSLTLILTGGINLLIDKKLDHSGQKSHSQLSFKSSFIIGIYQAIAIIPGISRSGSAVLGSLHQDLSRESAFKFAFLLAIPAILGASVLQLFDLYRLGFPVGPDSLAVFIYGSLAAFIFGMLSLFFFRFVIRKAKFEWFGIYCLLLGLASLGLQLFS